MAQLAPWDWHFPVKGLVLYTDLKALALMFRSSDYSFNLLYDVMRAIREPLSWSNLSEPISALMNEC